MKIYNHNCYSCGNGYKGVNKLPSICTECKRLIIKWYDVIKVLEEKGLNLEHLIDRLKITPPE
ncbi:hypothetical protein P4571_07850 [Niallia alba]|uniref:hypothetical protein n=1 Tax=Niallia alba TaxID=2729105 RepID=UPI002E1E5ECE|nr:hypothetical protein [Niallia alba]